MSDKMGMVVVRDTIEKKKVQRGSTHKRVGSETMTRAEIKTPNEQSRSPMA